jgi:hypothetical protein
MAAVAATKVKLFLAENLKPTTPPDAQSLEEQMNTFLATLTPANVLDVQVSLSKNGKYGDSPMFAGSILYKG